MLQLRSSRTKTAIIATAIFAIGCGAGFVNYRLELAQVGGELVHDAQIAAVTFDGEELRRLVGSRADIGTPAYARIKRRLQELQAADPRARFVYLFRPTGTGHVIFLADSAPAGSSEESLPGDDYPEAGNSPGLQAILRDGRPAIEGPLADSFGTWVTGYARVRPGPVSTPPSTGEILGIDLAAGDWNRILWFAGLRGALYTWTLLAFPVLAFLARRRHDAQREAIRNLSEAVEQSHSAIVIFDLEHRIEYANRGLCQQIGYGRRELIGRHWREFVADPDTSGPIPAMRAALRGGRAWEGEWHNRRQDGTVYPVHGRVTPVRLQGGVASCFVAIFDDVTEVKRTEAELREARDLAQAGDRAKSHFLATMSHEVRTPLNGIVGFTSLLLETPLSAEQREFVQTIRASGEALIQLTGDILDFARIESGKLKLDPTVCDPRECIEEALDLHAAKAAEKKVELLHHAAVDVPSAVVVDSGRLRQVLINLVGNAVKFTDRGEVEVTLAVRPGAPPSAGAKRQDPAAEPTTGTVTLEFSIRDTGIGIAPELHGRLFKPFSQLDESSTRRYGGAGLGLAICRNLVQLMGGEITFHSTPQQGSTFKVTVPAPVAAPPAPQQLSGLRIALGIHPGSLRRELADLLTSWGGSVEVGDNAAAIAHGAWDVALVEVSESIAAELVARPAPVPGLPPQKTLALVPISLPRELRTALRAHFRLLVNRPVHHAPFFALLSGECAAAGAPPAPAPQFGYRVLAVEDNPVNQKLVQHMLQGVGCTCTVLANGAAAITELTTRGAEIDLVLLDLHMPEMDGLSALECIRRGEAGPDAQSVWIVAVTADARPEQRTRAFQAGVNDYLTKPLRADTLGAALRRFQASRPAPAV